MEIEKILQGVGLEPKEAKVYLTCLQLGQDTAFNIAERSELKRSTVYVILDSLVQKELIVVARTHKATLYSPVEPNQLISQMKEKEDKLIRALPFLGALYNVRPQKPKIQIFENRLGIEIIYQEVIESLKTYQEIFLFGTIKQFKNNYQGLHRRWQLAMKNKKYKAKEILNENELLALDYIKKVKRNNNPNHQIRLMPKCKSLTNNNIIYGNKVAIFSVERELFVILIEAQDIAASYQNFFKLTWRSAIQVK